MPKNFTVQEVREFFRLNEKYGDVTVRRWIADRKFPNATKPGDGWLIPEEDVIAFYEAGKHKPPKRRQGMISHGVE